MGRSRANFNKGIELRPASKDDLGFLQRWRNDPDTVAMMRRQRIFTAEDTRRWIFEEGRSSLVAWRDEEPIGYLSFEPKETRMLEIGIIVSPEHRGLGLGKLILGKAHEFDPTAVLRAQIKADNPRSLAMFLACGFRPIETRDGYVEVERMP